MIVLAHEGYFSFPTPFSALGSQRNVRRNKDERETRVTGDELGNQGTIDKEISVQTDNASLVPYVQSKDETNDETNYER